jgi:hypothetical protein
MAQYTSYDTVGKKEDVSDVISNISPTKTPFQTMIGRESVHNTLFQWQEDSLAAVAVNSQTEGFTASDATLTPTVNRSGYTQILQKTIKVSGSVDSVDHYGRAKESAYQMAKASAEVKRDLEHACVGLAQAATAGSSGVARLLTSFYSQVATANKSATGGTSTIPTEAVFLASLQTAFTAGADPSVAMVTPTNSLTIADFAKASGRYRTFKEGDKNITNVVDLYVSPFGTVKVVINRFIKDKDTYIFDPANWKLAVFRNWFRETLAKTGDNTMMMIVGEFGLKHVNQLASTTIREAASV